MDRRRTNTNVQGVNTRIRYDFRDNPVSFTQSNRIIIRLSISNIISIMKAE